VILILDFVISLDSSLFTPHKDQIADLQNTDLIPDYDPSKVSGVGLSVNQDWETDSGLSALIDAKFNSDSVARANKKQQDAIDKQRALISANAINQAQQATANQSSIGSFQSGLDAYLSANPAKTQMDYVKSLNDKAFSDARAKYGSGAKEGGFVKKLLAEKMAGKNSKFNINKVSEPSKWLVEKYKNKVIMKVKPNIKLRIKEKKQPVVAVAPVAKSKAELKKEYDQKRYVEKLKKPSKTVVKPEDVGKSKAELKKEYDMKRYLEKKGVKK
jgi:hypothetical protein